ncbi:MAG: hypothetical protein KME16_23585 [Scytolyngbya sp. HA4215-MV1]|jgi:hypothetical protein|nr:hypothetical protein [Scytolyngbya sp. HA4215-MV1]
MNLTDLQRYDPDFDPKSFKSMPVSNQRIFNPDNFLTPSAHSEAEKAGTELIRSALSQQAGKPVYSQAEAISSGRSEKSKRIFEDLSTGQAVIR